ncbi:MAG: hypothetical protein WCI71_05725 [Bacteroidota bacterium]
MKKTTLEYRMSIENQRLKIPDSKLLTGSTAGKYPVIFDGGKTTIFISDKSKESETREKYELRKDNRVNFYTKKPKT